MSTPDPQQSMDVPSPKLGPPAASSNRHANGQPHANADPRDGASSDQANHDTRSRRVPPDRVNSDETTWDAASRQPKEEPSLRLNSQQATGCPISKRKSPAAPNSPRATVRSSVVETRDDPREGVNSGEAISGLSPRPVTPRRVDVPEQEGQSSGLTPFLLWDPVLQTLADGLDDIESTRIAQANRYRILTTTAEDSDGEVRGFGLATDHPAVVALDAQLKTLEFLDASMTKALRKQLRAHPLYPMVTRTKGLGDKTVARLLAAVRDPYWNDLHDRPRTIGELFAFCGVAGPGQRRVRGQKSNWNPDARKRLWIMTGPIIRGDGPYRDVYDAGRVRYADKVHTAPCAQCGKKGQPAESGSEWRDGHKHAGAIRLVMREILRDLWTEARDIYAAEPRRRTA